MVVVELRSANATGGLARIDYQKGFAICLVGLEGIIYYELLLYRQTVNSELYCQQLDHLKKQTPRSGQLWLIEKELNSIKTTANHIYGH